MFIAASVTVIVPQLWSGRQPKAASQWNAAQIDKHYQRYFSSGASHMRFAFVISFLPAETSVELRSPSRGCAAGGLFALAALALCLFCFLRRRRWERLARFKAASDAEMAEMRHSQGGQRFDAFGKPHVCIAYDDAALLKGHMPSDAAEQFSDMAITSVRHPPWCMSVNALFHIEARATWRASLLPQSLYRSVLARTWSSAGCYSC